MAGQARAMICLTRVLQNRLLDWGAVLIAAIGMSRIALILPERAAADDLAHYYVWSRTLLEGGNPYCDRELVAAQYAKQGFEFKKDTPIATNPPLMLWLFALIAALPVGKAFTVCVMAEFLSLFIILWLTRQLLAPQLTMRGWWFLSAAVVASAPVYWHFYYSQVQLPLTALLLCAYRFLRAGRPRTACALVTFLGLAKIYPFVFLPWFIWRAEPIARARITSAIGCLIGAGIIIELTGVGLWADFFQHASRLLRAWADYPQYFSFSASAFLTALNHAMRNVGPWAMSAGYCSAVGTLVGGLGLSTIYRILLRECGDLDLEFSLLGLTALVVNPITWGHYIVMLIFPFAVAATRVAAAPTRGRCWLLILAVIGVNNMAPWTRIAWHGYNPLIAVILNYTPLYGMLMLGVLFASELRKCPHGSVR